MKSYLPVYLIVLMVVVSSVACFGAVTVAPSIAPQEGYVEVMQLRSTLWGIQQAALGKSDTLLLMKDQVVVFLWSVRDAWAFAGVNLNGQPEAVDLASQITKANLVNARDMSDIAKYLNGLGFQQITPDKLPPVLVTAIAQGAGWLAEMAQRMVTVLVVPAGFFMLPEEYRDYEG